MPRSIKYWFYFNWSQDSPEASDFHINEKEVIAITLAAYRWTLIWPNKRIIVYSDNTVSVASINKCTSRNVAIMKCLQSLFWLSALYNFHLTANFLPGVRNIAADSASRFHLPGYLHTLLPFTEYTPLACHMSYKSLQF